MPFFLANWKILTVGIIVLITGAVLAAGGAALWFKRDTEPK